MKPNKDKQHLPSYRPISLLSCLGKLLEKIIKQRLMLGLERRNILPEHQAGFRPRKSTIHNIVRLERYAQNQLRRARPRRYYILFDIKAAFDSVWHDDSMNDIPTHTEHGLFADDTVLWTSANTMTCLSSRLQQSEDAFESWCKSWKLKLQPTKTEMIHFTIHPRKTYKHPVEVKCDNTIIKPLDHTRYLGVIIDKRLNWRRHLNHIETKIAPRIGVLRYPLRTA
ncbi:unnamed protein product [Rotaria magnacalcarata]|uniref:Reverse transcriptase domain-containing protein n=3 Tax=Rotaria magnacalcarata TaxID=392030 RepID=A0A820N7D9_9BILA|nr:unnamed protein product [Rotaria magnacalcarata]CAF4382970.1 unnamed protein product [Rotaria magnacalcarata]